jgi:hypothetical protein
MRRNIKNEFRETWSESVEGLGEIHLAQETDKYHVTLDRLLNLRVKAFIEFPRKW